MMNWKWGWIPNNAAVLRTYSMGWKLLEYFTVSPGIPTEFMYVCSILAYTESLQPRPCEKRPPASQPAVLGRHTLVMHARMPGQARNRGRVACWWQKSKNISINTFQCHVNPVGPNRPQTGRKVPSAETIGEANSNHAMLVADRSWMVGDLNCLGLDYAGWISPLP